MLFVRRHKSSANIQAKHQERCAQITGFLGFLMLVLASLMLYFAITTEYSEQKTMFYILFAACLCSFGLLVGITIYQLKKSQDKKRSFVNYQINQRNQTINRCISRSNVDLGPDLHTQNDYGQYNSKTFLN
ncbi:hypothetical protein BpHYR1_004620 [Brachionus plicatilis]|uniref:Uncharacterized protein n=1 Tax=Brachionus plicatilis TaxID=10195 RepID=A0A3M7S7Y3_BRAPC|nr:hypothetical protein BpHYR1_004620 [Brachionus plicatilis]